MNSKRSFRPRSYWSFKAFSRFRICSGLIGAILFLLGYIMRPEALRIVVMAAGALCMLSEIPAFFLFWRCPHCHALRPWHYSGKDLHCAVCGKVLESP